MITIATPDHEADADRVEAFRENARRSRSTSRHNTPTTKATTPHSRAYEQWRTQCVPGTVTQELRTPEEYDELGEQITTDHVEENVRVSGTLEDHVDWLETDRELDVDRIFVHNVNTNQRAFIETFGETVLPHSSDHPNKIVVNIHHYIVRLYNDRSGLPATSPHGLLERFATSHNRCRIKNTNSRCSTRLLGS